MPLLDDDTLHAMRSKIKHCDRCLGTVLKNYCRECDEFFEYGHLEECAFNLHQHDDHKNHRTY